MSVFFPIKIYAHKMCGGVVGEWIQKTELKCYKAIKLHIRDFIWTQPFHKNNTSGCCVLPLDRIKKHIY